MITVGLGLASRWFWSQGCLPLGLVGLRCLLCLSFALTWVWVFVGLLWYGFCVFEVWVCTWAVIEL